MTLHTSKNRSHRLIADINVTPMVDVMLVLLVIFIMAAPLLTQSVKVDLPTAKGNDTSIQTAAVVLSIDAQGQFFIDKRQVSPDDLLNSLTALAQKNAQTTINISADQTVAYAKLAHLLAALQTAGLSKINFITQTGPTQ